MSAITIKKTTTPSGVIAHQFSANGQRIGFAYEVDGGYLAIHHRKPVKTVEEAAQQCLKLAIRRERAQIKLLETFLVKVKP